MSLVQSWRRSQGHVHGNTADFRDYRMQCDQCVPSPHRARSQREERQVRAQDDERRPTSWAIRNARALDSRQRQSRKDYCIPLKWALTNFLQTRNGIRSRSENLVHCAVRRTGSSQAGTYRPLSATLAERGRDAG